MKALVNDMTFLLFLALTVLYLLPKVLLHSSPIAFPETLSTTLHQAVDSITNTNYSPPTPQIADLASNAGMTDYAKQIFYSTKPVIDTDRNTFANHCHTPVVSNGVELGCYTPDNRIYILQINNPKLQSEMVVVAAHEMLHAAYEKLPASQKVTINAELEQEVPKIYNTKLANELRSYQQTEPGEQDNELHSIIGTEYQSLNPSLEQYYSQYFANRSTVVSDAEQFDNAFTQSETSLTNLRLSIRQHRREMIQDLRLGDIDSYNALVGEMNDEINQYNQEAQQYNDLSLSLMGQQTQVSNQ